MERYEEYKNSGVEWIGDIPSHWALRRGSTIGDYSKGAGITKGEVVEEGFPCVRYGELYTRFNHALHEPVSFIESPGQVLASRGAIFITASGETVEEIGKCVVYLGDCEISVGGDIIVLDAAQDYDSEYLSYLINSEGVRCQRAAAGRGGIIVHIYSKNFRQMAFVHPPVEEQERIVAFLDERTGWIDEAVKKTEKKIALLKEQRASLINEVVTKGLDPNVEMKDSGVEWIGDIPSHWDGAELKRLVQVIPSNVDKHIIEGELPVKLCNYTDVYYNEKISDDQDLTEGSCTDRELERYSVREGDVIITKDSESPDDIGIPVLIEKTLPNVVCGYHLTMLRGNGINGRFLFRYIQSNSVRAYFEVNSSGVTRFSLGKSSIAEMKTLLPPVEEQERIVAFLDERTGMMDEVIAKEEERIVLLKEYRQSLISEVVTGKRKVLDEPVGLN
jgi:type I restriction enzyme S subunit